jgi:hypothetical protein
MSYPPDLAPRVSYPTHANWAKNPLHPGCKPHALQPRPRCMTRKYFQHSTAHSRMAPCFFRLQRLQWHVASARSTQPLALGVKACGRQQIAQTENKINLLTPPSHNQSFLYCWLPPYIHGGGGGQWRNNNRLTRSRGMSPSSDAKQVLTIINCCIGRDVCGKTTSDACIGSCTR